MKVIIDFINNYGKMVVIFLLITAACSWGFDSQLTRTEEESRKILEDSLQRATIQCYALESRYPPSVEYLEENYGIVIDWEKYHVFYNGFASNVMPDLTVVILPQEGAR